MFSSFPSKTAPVIAGWGGAAFAVQTAFAMATFGLNAWVILVYVLGFAATFPLERKTRGPVALAVAFALAWALFVEGLCFLVATEVASSRRFAFAGLLAAPLAALVVRRFATDADDAWFAKHARSVVLLAFVVAAPLLGAGAYGSLRADPAAYGRARRALGYDPFEALLVEGLAFDRTVRGRQGWTVFQSAWSGVEPEIRAEVGRACSSLAQKDPWRACACADELLLERYRVVERRRDTFRGVALVSAVPWGILALFAWRGRRGRFGVHAKATE